LIAANFEVDFQSGTLGELPMKNTLAAATVAALTGIAGVANAADIYAPAAVGYKDVVVVAPIWAGFYVGANLGGAWSNSHAYSPLYNTGAGQQYIPSVVTDINAQANRNLDTSEFTGGGQIGYNIQRGNFVAGAVVDFDSFALSKSQSTVTNFTGFAPPVTYSDSISTSWLLTARAKLGYAADQYLIYVTGGAAFTNLKYQHGFIEGVFPGTSLGTENSTVSATQSGWTVGAGIEYALSHNWSLGAEYLYVDFGKVAQRGSPVIFPGGPGSSFFDHSADLTANIVRATINYHINWYPEPLK
jgi:outer membrane immunogenic protein